MIKYSKFIIGVVTSMLLIPMNVYAYPIAGHVAAKYNTGYSNPTQYVFSQNSIWEDAEEQIKIEAELAEQEAIKQAEIELEEQRKAEEQAYLAQLQEYEINYLAKLAWAEAGNQSDYGIRLVIDTVLNRVDSSRFNNDIVSVINESGQFETYSNGAVSSAPVYDWIVELVKEEMVNRTNYEVLFFTAGGYNPYCIPLYQVEDHYFGK